MALPVSERAAALEVAYDGAMNATSFRDATALREAADGAPAPRPELRWQNYGDSAELHPIGATLETGTSLVG